jgi:hypothetical protein
VNCKHRPDPDFPVVDLPARASASATSPRTIACDLASVPVEVRGSVVSAVASVDVAHLAVVTTLTRFGFGGLLYWTLRRYGASACSARARRSYDRVVATLPDPSPPGACRQHYQCIHQAKYPPLWRKSS